MMHMMAISTWREPMLFLPGKTGIGSASEHALSDQLLTAIEAGPLPDANGEPLTGVNAPVAGSMA